ncbi:hypothetical protein R3P38DRAFT_2813720 [Favolaschia claudopus]|uniref:Uncharacterized protein n=1 Tax=Favolaschia claudopus TaxID=2862362 RepID=A0AAV9Z4Q7_9AGAR
MINELVALDGMRPNKVANGLKRFAEKLGIEVAGDISDRTVRVGTARGLTLSGDGTTHRNINLESHRATVINQGNEKQNFFLGIGMAINLNHTSEKQLEGWEELIETAYGGGQNFMTSRNSGQIH